MSFSLLQVYKDYYPPVVGGIERHVHSLANALQGRCRVRVLVANRNRRTEHEVVDGVPVTRVADLGRFLSAPVSPAFPYWLKRLDSDLVHFHLPNPTAEISALLSRPRGKVVATYHSDIVRQKLTGALYAPALRAFLRRADALIVTSPIYARTSPVLGEIAERCRVIPLGVDPKPYEQTAEMDERVAELLGRTPGPRIYFLGVLRYYKGLPYLVRAMRDLSAHLYIGGDGPVRPELERLVRATGLADRVHFLGALAERDAIAWMHACDVFCLPAHLRSEAFGLCQVEAHLCGKPVVSTRLDTGVPFVNQHEVTGLVVPPRSPEALAEALARLLADGDLRARLGAKARARALEEFTLETMIGRLWRVYLELLDGRPGQCRVPETPCQSG
ncbi:MAG: glycosyltransferase [Candidatus Eisenbacteria bacterium]